MVQSQTVLVYLTIVNYPKLSFVYWKGSKYSQPPSFKFKG